jgi:hypothetical protein
MSGCRLCVGTPWIVVDVDRRGAKGTRVIRSIGGSLVSPRPISLGLDRCFRFLPSAQEPTKNFMPVRGLGRRLEKRVSQQIDIASGCLHHQLGTRSRRGWEPGGGNGHQWTLVVAEKDGHPCFVADTRRLHSSLCTLQSSAAWRKAARNLVDLPSLVAQMGCRSSDSLVHRTCFLGWTHVNVFPFSNQRRTERTCNQGFLTRWDGALLGGEERGEVREA